MVTNKIININCISSLDGQTASGAYSMDSIRADASSIATIYTTIFAHTLVIEWLSRTKAISEYTNVASSPLNSITSQPIKNGFDLIFLFIIASIMAWNQKNNFDKDNYLKNLLHKSNEYNLHNASFLTHYLNNLCLTDKLNFYSKKAW